MSLLNRLAVVAGLTVGVSAAGLAVAAEPDVVVSTIGSGFSKYGTKNVGTAQSPVLVTGYAVTTVSCNIGTDLAEWFQNNNQHPVIGTQMYRLHNGRFEQIGMNWLKHGFCAADAPQCTNLGPAGSAYAPNGSCDWLGLYATDTYSTGLNGQQSLCGPRSEVNPATGVFPYPYQLNWGLSGDCVYKRLQIFNSDVDPANYAGGRYFVEVHYVTTDEGTFNRANNASYREAIVGTLSNGSQAGSCGSSTQGYGLSFSGSTVPLKPAIDAWATLDVAVRSSTVDIAGDGRIKVSSKATDLGGGNWSYEYAVYNHNSHRGVGSFSIAKNSNPAVTFSSIGFHDVAYHSGEPYDGTDWVPSLEASTLSWATVPFDTNPNANALRWGTLYNFRFVCNQPPTTGAVTLGLFRTGLPGSVEAAGLHIPIMPAELCPADFNQSGGAPTVEDIFDFLAAYFNSAAAADFNGVGGVTVQDIFDFVAAYFTACP